MIHSFVIILWHFLNKAGIGFSAFWNPPLQLYLECHMLISDLACKGYTVEFTFVSLVTILRHFPTNVVIRLLYRRYSQV